MTRVPSASLVVVVDGKIVYTQAYGDSRLDLQRIDGARTRYNNRFPED